MPDKHSNASTARHSQKSSGGFSWLKCSGGHTTLQRLVWYNWTSISLTPVTFYSKKELTALTDSMAISIFTWLEIHALWKICNVQSICGNHHAESNLATHRSSLISQERGKRGQARWFMAAMMHPGPEWLISAGNTFRSTSLTSEHTLPKHKTHTYSLAHVRGRFLGVRGERSYLLPGHILYVMTFYRCASVLVWRWMFVRVWMPLVEHFSKPFHRFHF